MSVVKVLTTVLALLLSTLACGQYITPTPDNSPTTAVTTPAPATLAPSATPTQPAPSRTAEAGEVATVKAALVNVRAEPAGEVVRQLEAGQAVTVLDIVTLENGEQWAQIETEGAAGYVFLGCLSIGEGKGCVAR